ncbi:GGDEF domain-containing protein [Pseudonocardia sp. HH130630-07]|uniref:GGDEF domain-containing protein n=1 Tax=Pseudonocardia sp. HH130630-07 TaxID=1690815 RepID=UPI000814EEEF|nr:sensor domain-containing diguanylate cyclase [Pseudonocardia sp. HH130630-07]ANY05029.1 hypothetical protein AFB00_00315 [Pseudonocardia sp. HH130630-07]
MTEPTADAPTGRGAFRELPSPMIAVFVVVVASALALVVGGLVTTTAEPSVGIAALGALGLIALGVLHTELATGIERVRRRVAHASYFDLSSVWTFSGALVLPPALAGVVVIGIYSHLWWRVWRPAGAALYRHVYTTATVVLAAGAAGVIVTPELLTGIAGVEPLLHVTGFGALLLAMAAYMLVNQMLVALALSLTSGRIVAWRAVLGDGDDLVLEGATLCLAMLTALTALHQVALVPLVLPPLLVLHRAVLIRQLEERANTDAKTGLLTATAWRGRALRAVARSRRRDEAVAVLILDLDHFKSVNDGYGHLAGDEVLTAVAEAVSAQVRDVDPVGRFGGEEFVVLLPGLPYGDPGYELAHAAGERIRSTVRELVVDAEAPGGPLTITDLSVSVGVALAGSDGDTLDELLQIADHALYAAKRGGRNQVRLGRALSG